MPNKSKAKGNRFEYQVRDAFKNNGIECKRAYGSDGRSLGYQENVDLVVDHGIHYTIQCKVRKSISKFIKPASNIFAQIIKEDRGETICAIRLQDLIKLMKRSSP